MALRTSLILCHLFVFLSTMGVHVSAVQIEDENKDNFLRSLRDLDGCESQRLLSYCVDMLKLGSFNTNHAPDMLDLQSILIDREIGSCSWGELGLKTTPGQCMTELIRTYHLYQLFKVPQLKNGVDDLEHSLKFWTHIYGAAKWCVNHPVACHSASTGTIRLQ